MHTMITTMIGRCMMPWVGDSWESLFDWNGWGEMPENERVLLSSHTQQAHDNGQVMRFWAVPDNGASWAEQVNAGVDYINSDKLPELAAFFASIDTVDGE